MIPSLASETIGLAGGRNTLTIVTRTVLAFPAPDPLGNKDQTKHAQAGPEMAFPT